MSAFSIFKDKRKQNKQQTPTAQAYYTRLANRAKIGMFSAIIALIIFCLLAYTFFPDELTAENFKYLLKFISFEQTEQAEVGAEIIFDSDPTNRFAIVRGDIAVLSKTQLTVYDTSGQLLQRTPVKNDNPVLLTAGKNMIIYDLGGKQLDVYNSFSHVYSENFGYPVLGVSAAENGSYAVLSGAKNYRSAVFVYDANYRLTFSHYFPTEYSTAMQLDKSGQKVLVLSHISENGDYLGSAALFSTTAEEPLATFRYVGELPLNCHFTDDGGYMVLTDKALRFYDRDNALKKEVAVSGVLLNCDFGGNHVMLTFDKSGLSESKEMVVYDSAGNNVYRTESNSRPDDVLLYGNRLYMLSVGNLTVYDFNEDKKIYDIQTDADGVDMLISDDKLLVFTYSGVTVYNAQTLDETEIQPDDASLTEVSE
ncbi:MAG: hypothetical protein II987_02930 [Clostridia bacterium]|nr:hypothetical protein [Clostridia bacterium]